MEVTGSSVFETLLSAEVYPLPFNRQGAFASTWLIITVKGTCAFLESKASLQSHGLAGKSIDLTGCICAYNICCHAERAPVTGFMLWTSCSCTLSHAYSNQIGKELLCQQMLIYMCWC